MPDFSAQPPPAIDTSRPQAGADTPIGSPALMALWIATETMRQDVARRCVAWAHRLHDAFDDFQRVSLPELRGSSTDVYSLAMRFDLPYAPELTGTAPPMALRLGTAAPPHTPAPCEADVLWASYQQLGTIEAAACGSDALCTLTLEPLNALTQPVAACHGAVVQVYEYSALQHFWQVYPERKMTTPSYMPIGTLRRVVNTHQVPRSDQ